jgi:hypothetical protein
MEPDVHAQQRVVTGERTVEEATYASEPVVRNQACVSYLEGQGMTQDEIIEMLRASCDKDRVDPEQNGFWVIVTEELEAFAKLAAEKEREACANVCEALEDDGGEWDIQQQCANAIRARGQA